MEAAVPTLDSTMGAMFIGVVVSAALLGVSIAQAFWYFTESNRDPVLLKVLVVVLMVFDTTHLALISHGLYFYTISNFFNPAGLGNYVWSLAVEALFTCLTGALVQLFYTHRFWRLGHSLAPTTFSKANLPITVTLVILILANTACQFAWVILALRCETFFELLSISKLTHTINGLTVGIDVIIAVALVIMLLRAKSGFKGSDTIITKLIIFVVNTGALTSMCAVASLVSLAVSTRTLIYGPFYFCIGRLYVNSLLATLNARSSIRDQNSKDTDHMFVSIPQNILYGSGTSSTTRTPHRISIHVEATEEQDEPGHPTPFRSDEASSQKDTAL